MPKTTAIRKPKLKKRAAFEAAASELGGTFVAGTWRSGDEIHLEHGPWEITLDTYVVSTGTVTVSFTRTRALYVAKDDFTLRVSRKNVYHRIGEFFGFHGFRIGDHAFERRYKIKCSNDRLGKSLLDARLRELIKLEPSIEVMVRRRPWSRRRKSGDGVRSVIVQTTGIIKDPDRLTTHLRLVTGMLDQLLRIGSAADEPVVEGHTYALTHRLQPHRI